MNLVDEAYHVLLKNSREGKTRDGREYFYICPAEKRYPHQWLWDSSFHAIAMSHFDIGKAKSEILTLLSLVSSDGFLPQIVYWQANLMTKIVNKFIWGNQLFSKLTQVPVIGIALKEVYEKDKDKEFLRKSLPKARSFYQWLAKNRDPDGNKLVSIIHPFESGRDETPEFDHVFGLHRPHMWTLYHWLIEILLQARKKHFSCQEIYEAREMNVFLVSDLLFNCVYSQGLKAISELSRESGELEEAELFLKMNKEVEEAILNLCFNQESEIYYSLWFRDQKQLPITTVASLFPLILDSLPEVRAEALVKNHLLNLDEFWLPYPIPCVPKNNPHFHSSSTRFLWRGPTWVNINWFLVKGLEKHGYKDLALEITEKTKRMIQKEGFWEFYNPFTGKGLRTHNYGWSTLIVDML